MMYIGSDEDILGLPSVDKTLLTQLKHKSNVKVNDYKSSGFLFADIKIKEAKEMVVEIVKPKRHDRHKKSSNLF